MDNNDIPSPKSEQIEKYLAGTMPEPERLDFEKQMEENPALKQEIKESALAKWTIQAYAREEEKKQLDALYQANEKEARKLSLLHYKWTAVAAVFAVLVLGYFLFKPSKSFSNQELFAAYYELPQAPDIMGANTEEMLRKGDLAYSEQKYAEALGLYEHLETDSLTDFQLSRIALFKGISHTELNQWEQAIESYTHAVQHPEQGDWYKALLYLKKDDQIAAKEALQKIIDSPEHFYREKAKEILDKMAD